MIPIRILYLSLAIIPLTGSLTLGPFLSITNAKEFLVLMSILGIVLLGSLAHGREPQKTHNIPLYLLMAFLPISAYSAPPLRLMYGNANLGGLWIWKGMAWAFAYFMLYRAILALSITECQKRIIAKCIGWPAIISAGYAYVQAMGLDQWQFTKSYHYIGYPGAADITAVIGNSTYLGVWLVMCLPFLWLFFKKRWTFFVAGAVLLTQSDFAIGGLIFLAVFMICMRDQSMILLKVGAVIIAIIATACLWSQIRPHISDNGRFAMWAQMWDDWRGPCIKIPITGDMTRAQKIEIENLNKRNYAFTGRGLGSFPHIFGVSHNSRWESPHNEYLAGLYCLGLIGTVLMILALGQMFWGTFGAARSDPWALALYCSSAYICLAAIGISVWHVEPLRYFSAVIFSFLSAFSPTTK